MEYLTENFAMGLDFRDQADVLDCARRRYEWNRAHGRTAEILYDCDPLIHERNGAGAELAFARMTGGTANLFTEHPEGSIDVVLLDGTTVDVKMIRESHHRLMQREYQTPKAHHADLYVLLHLIEYPVYRYKRWVATRDLIQPDRLSRHYQRPCYVLGQNAMHSRLDIRPNARSR